VGPNQGGYLVIKKPWPSMLRTVWGDPDRYAKTYFSDYPGIYFTGDGARRDEDGYFWIMGRVDDVINVAGRRPRGKEGGSGVVDLRQGAGGARGGTGRPCASAQGGGGGRRRQAGRKQGGGYCLRLDSGDRGRAVGGVEAGIA